MAKAKTRTTPNPAPRHEPADDWRLAQLRRRAVGKGKHPLPAGRYTPVKRTLRNGVQPRPLSAAQSWTLWKLCTLSAYHPDGFTFTPEMTAVCQHISDQLDAESQSACLTQADRRERAYIAR
jgi:hypothetical protein